MVLSKIYKYRHNSFVQRRTTHEQNNKCEFQHQGTFGSWHDKNSRETKALQTLQSSSTFTPSLITSIRKPSVSPVQQAYLQDQIKVVRDTINPLKVTIFLGTRNLLVVVNPLARAPLERWIATQHLVKDASDRPLVCLLTVRSCVEIVGLPHFRRLQPIHTWPRTSAVFSMSQKRIQYIVPIYK